MEKWIRTDDSVVPNGIVGREQTRTGVPGISWSVVPLEVRIDDIPFSMVSGGPVYTVAAPRAGFARHDARATSTRSTSAVCSSTGGGEDIVLASKRNERRL